jgi:hypothetical protein
VAILQQGGTIERSLSRETADPDCAASAARAPETARRAAAEPRIRLLIFIF